MRPNLRQPFPHAVSSISGSVVNTTFSYNANGNMISGNGLAISWTAFNKPESIARGSSTLIFSHDTERARFKQINPTGETLYLNDGGVMSERLAGSGGTVEWTDYLFDGPALKHRSGASPDRVRTRSHVQNAKKFLANHAACTREG